MHKNIILNMKLYIYDTMHIQFENKLRIWNELRNIRVDH
jgi:hypothetical protein